VTVEAIKAAGGVLAYYPCYREKKSGEKKRTKTCRQVVALPAYGEWLLAGDPVAWVLWDITGADFDVTPKGYPADQPRLTAKMLSIGQTRGAMMGLAGLMALSDPEQRAAVEWVWKTGGPTDLLGLMAAIPQDLRGRHVVVTNASGETGDVLPHQAKLLAGLRVAVVGDCDEAGVVGAAKWCRALDGMTAETRNVRLPWPIEPKHGRDVRDFLAGTLLPGEPEPAPGTGPATRSYSALLALADSTEPWNRPPEQGHTLSVTAGPDGQPTAPEPTDRQIDLYTDSQIAAALQIDVLGRTPEGQIKVYSENLRRTVLVSNVAKLKYEDLLLHFGTPVRKVVSRTNEDSAPGMYPIRDVREALAHLGSCRLLGDETEMGLGVWPCRDLPDCGAVAGACGCQAGEEGSQPTSIVLVNASEAARIDGARAMTRITHPRHNGNLLSFESGAKPWYDFDRLAGMLREADNEAWRYAVVDDLVTLWQKWRWRGKHDEMIVAGLVLATWVQSLWEWRPRIDVLGPSNCGKSMLCSALDGIFSGLCLLTSDTTAAGLSQTIANRMLAVIVDEVDAKNKAKMQEQRKILEMLRSASRGTTRIRGSGNHKAVKFTLRHLVWVAGITLSYDDQADRNRAVLLNLVLPTPEKAGKLVLPPVTELADLGQRSLAVALWASQEARKLAIYLKDQKIPGADPRLVESYSVPAAMIAVVMGYDQAFAITSLGDMLESAKSDIPVEADESNLVAAILSAIVQVSAGHRLTVGQVLELLCDPTASYREDWAIALERCGIKLAMFGFSDGVPKALSGRQALLLNYQMVRDGLLRGSRWEGQPIDQVIRRIPGCLSGHRRIGGVKGRVAMLPFDEFRDRYIGRQDQEPQEPVGF
jgi:hypothetical protein